VRTKNAGMTLRVIEMAIQVIRTVASCWLSLLPAQADHVKAQLVASVLIQGMTESQVEQVLGRTIYSLHISSLGLWKDYERYSLRVIFHYGALHSCCLLRVEPFGERTYRHVALRDLAVRRSRR
jgi:hypothetical protein